MRSEKKKTGWKNSGKTWNKMKTTIERKDTGMDKREKRDCELQGQAKEAWEIWTKLNGQKLSLKDSR